MATTLGDMTIEDAAREMAGNWKLFDSFVWDRDNFPHADNWAIVYTHNRDSGLLSLSNAQAIAKALTPYSDGDDPRCRFRVALALGCWTCGRLLGPGLSGRCDDLCLQGLPRPRRTN